MLDRILIVVLIGLVFFGVSIFDDYVRDKGGTSVASQFVEFIGLANFKKFIAHKLLEPERSQRFETQSKLDQLGEIHKSIAEESNKYIQNREILLERIITLNRLLMQEAKEQSDRIKVEEKRLLESGRQIEELGQSVFNARQEPNLELREQYYLQIREKLVEVFEEVMIPLEEGAPRVAMILERIDRLMRADPYSQVVNCDSDLETCLQENLNSLKQEHSYLVSRFVVSPRKDIDRINYLIDLLQTECKLLFDNARGTDDYFGTQNQEMMSIFQQLAEMHLEITGKDLFMLINSHDTLVKEQTRYLDNLKLNIKRVYDQYKVSYNEIEKIFQYLKGLETIDLSSFENFIFETQSKTNSAFAEFEINERRIIELSQSHMQENWLLIEDIADSLKIDINRARVDEDYAQRVMTHSMQNKLGLR